MTIKERIFLYLKSKGISKSAFEKSAGLSNGYLNNFKGNIGLAKLEGILIAFPDLNKDWLLTGEGDMFTSYEPIEYIPEDICDYEDETGAEGSGYIPMLPLQAIGGSLTGFDDSATLEMCERVLSPIKDIDFAMEVYGDSMAPDYPSGARIFIKRIDMEAFIEWGRVYVLDTINGSIVKEVYPSGESAVECRSINTQYPPFVVQRKDIRRMYRVLMTMMLK